MKKKIFIIDTSVILSGIPINLNNISIITTSSVSREINPGGRDYRLFQFLQEKGLKIQSASKNSIKEIQKTAEKNGEIKRLSSTDVEILALALDINKNKDKEAVILTDDYSIQNVAYILNIEFQNFSQRRITKKFKWLYRCQGCGKRFTKSIEICPICGTETKSSLIHKDHIK